MKYLIFGLGNIGAEYENTRHNIGFLTLDALAKASNVSFSTQRYGDVAEIKHKGRKLILVKPSTYMNLSGKCVKYWMDKEKVNQVNIMIVTDDLALPFGKLRMKKKGSDGGHNGLKSIIEHLGNNSFPRLRFGIGDEFAKGKQVNYVLGEWNDQEKQTLNERIDLACQMILSYASIGIEQTMSSFNNK